MVRSTPSGMESKKKLLKAPPGEIICQICAVVTCKVIYEKNILFKPTNKAEIKTVLQAFWEVLPQASIDLAVLAFRNRLQARIRRDGRHVEHLFK